MPKYVIPFLLLLSGYSHDLTKYLLSSEKEEMIKWQVHKNKYEASTAIYYGDKLGT